MKDVLRDQADKLTKQVKKMKKILEEEQKSITNQSVKATEENKTENIKEKNENNLEEQNTVQLDTEEQNEKEIVMKQDLKQAFKTLQKAAVADRDENFLQALDLYHKGLNTLSTILRDPAVNEHAKFELFEKYVALENRVEILVKVLDKYDFIAYSSNQLFGLFAKVSEEIDKKKFKAALHLYVEPLAKTCSSALNRKVLSPIYEDIFYEMSLHINYQIKIFTRFSS